MSNGYNHSFKKLIFLPSNGLEYEPYAFFYNVTMELTLLSLDKNSSNTTFENIVQIIDKYVQLPTKITEMFNIDLYFIWATLLSLEINNEDKHTVGDVCSKCGEFNTVSVNFSDHKTNIINPYKNTLKELSVKIDEYNITFDLRKVKDNIDFIYLRLYDKEKTNINNIIYYLASQITNINNSNDKKDIFEILSWLSYKNLILLLEMVIKYNYIFGIENDVMYRCVKCRGSNYVSVFDDFRLSILNPSGRNDNKLIGFYKDNIEFSQLNIMNISEYMNIPYRDNEFFNQGLQGAKLMPRGF